MSAHTLSRPAAIPSLDGAAPLVVVENLTKTYRGRPALDGLSLDLPPADRRPHGLQRIGQDHSAQDPGRGPGRLRRRVRIAGHDPGPESKALVSFLPDASFLASGLTASAAIAQYRRFFADFDADKAAELVRFFNLPTDRTLKEMSKGMGEKLRISLAMSRRARVYLLDEPISGVDPAARDVILSGILRDFDPEALMLISTHLIADVEPIIDSVVFLKDGRLLLAGDADDLRQDRGMSLDALFRKEYR